MSSAAGAVDEAVREYLLFRGFAKTLQTFEAERRNDPEKGLKVRFSSLLLRLLCVCFDVSFALSFRLSFQLSFQLSFKFLLDFFGCLLSSFRFLLGFFWVSFGLPFSFASLSALPLSALSLFLHSISAVSRRVLSVFSLSFRFLSLSLVSL